MNINRYNYEEFFLLYVDNELDAASRKAVEQFIEANPDLEEELVMFQQSTLRTDDSLTIEKSGLFRKEDTGLINHTNYEDYFVLYVDEELTAEERRAVEEFAAKNPSLQTELELLMKTRIAADLSIVFPEKSLLFREEKIEKRVVFFSFSVRVAIAAMLLLAVGIFWIVSQNGSKPGEKIVATKPTSTPTQKTEIKKVEEASNPSQSNDNAEKQLVKNEKSGVRNEKSEMRNEKSEVRNEKSEPFVAKGEVNEPEKVVTHSSVTEPSKLLADNSTTMSDKTIEIVDRPSVIVPPNPLVTTTATGGQAFDEKKEDEVVVGPGIDTKNKLRGFFRKVTRVIGKTTHLPATENKSLLIGNIEIALK